jgi:hypothetical protein
VSYAWEGKSKHQKPSLCFPLPRARLLGRCVGTPGLCGSFSEPLPTRLPRWAQAKHRQRKLELQQKRSATAPAGIPPSLVQTASKGTDAVLAALRRQGAPSDTKPTLPITGSRRNSLSGGRGLLKPSEAA